MSAHRDPCKTKPRAYRKRSRRFKSDIEMYNRRVAISREPKIQTSPIFPPIPIRGLDWAAHFDNYEPGQPIGHGATEQEAIEDLLSIVEGIDAKSIS